MTLSRALHVATLLLVGKVIFGSCAPAAEEAEMIITPERSGSEETTTTTAEIPTPVQTNEEPCIKSGGLCVLVNECPERSLADTKGLCPTQQSRGVECCYGLSIKERRCSARGGICRPKQKCGRSLWDEKAKDCASDETCCILVS